MLNRLYKDYELVMDDVHIQYSKKDPGKVMFKIIKRTGVEKIKARMNIVINYDLLKAEQVGNGMSVIVKATASAGDNTIQTFGECSPYNSTQSYPVAIAEKRAKSRAVLQLAGLYSEGFYGQDEAEDFDEAVRSADSIEQKGKAIRTS